MKLARSRLRRCLLLAGALACVPAAAQAAARPVPLVDVPPVRTGFTDRVLHGPGPAAARSTRQAAPGRTASYATSDGQTVSVTFSTGYAPDPAVAQTYVDFLGSIPHGRELSSLKMFLAPPEEVTRLCGGVEGTLACYSTDSNVMTVPGEPVDESNGVSTSYVVAHEYGHHVAAFRDNDPWPAIAYGPKYWASYQLVCQRANAGLLAPGDQDEDYLRNPGEGWADTYAHLVYPDVFWQYSKLLKPDEGAYATARRDVLDPWTGPVTKTFKGRITAQATTRRFRFKIRLDGILSAALTGPRGTNFDLRLSSGQQVVTTTRTKGSRDRIAPFPGCRDLPAEELTLTVLRRSGSGSFTVKVTYPG